MYALLDNVWLIVEKLNMHPEKYCLVIALIKCNLSNG